MIKIKEECLIENIGAENEKQLPKEGL